MSLWFFKRNHNEPVFLVFSKLLAQLEYRPQWRFVCVPGLTEDHLVVHLSARVMDADNHKNQVQVHQAAIVTREDAEGYISDEKKLLAWARLLIQQLETHEMDEFIHFKGTKPFDPHKGEKS